MLEHLFFCCVVRFWIQISLNSISCIWLELGRKRNRSIEESLKPKPRESKTQSGPLPQPNFLSFPSPRGPRTLPEPTHERPSLSPPRPIRAPRPAPTPHPLRPSPARDPRSPSSSAREHAPLPHPRTHCQPAQARPQSARPARPTPLSLTRWPHPPGSPSTSRNGCARPAEIPGETTGGFLPQPRPQSPASLL